MVTRESVYIPADQRARLGTALIWMGVLVWVPYFYLKLFTQTIVEVMQFLPVHLFSVLIGITLLVISGLLKRKAL